MPPDQAGFLRRAHRFLVYFGGIYACFIVFLTIPQFQRHLIFLHKLKWPLFPDFAQPEKYGLAPQKTTNVNITTIDNVRLGAWFILSDAYYASSHLSPVTSKSSSTSSNASISFAVQHYPTILYFHGNGGTRAIPFRVASYASYTTRLGANVLALDYRGYADSEGTPTEKGLLKDARAAWQWIIDQGAAPEDIVLVGQSLGTAVAANLAQDLAAENMKPRGLVLLAPFSSLAALLETYNLGGWVPLLKPLQSIPFAQSLVLSFLETKFNTKVALANVKTNIVLIHADDDFDIPSSHSADLFNTLLEPWLPPPVLTREVLRQPVSISPEQWNEFRTGEALRRRVRNDIIQIDQVEQFGRISRFKRNDSETQVVYVESRWGGHNHVGRLEGVIDVVGDVLGIKRAC
ncbi:Alpha/Beta hydrolase protein [Gautieria morchelliformis]|nr:Alpha/Beta hydrolase protein [Gautieria morchelliformis]